MNLKSIKEKIAALKKYYQLLIKKLFINKTLNK